MERESREVAIRFTIARIFFASINFTRVFKPTLLPPRIVSLLSSLKLEVRSTAECYEIKETPLGIRKFKLTQIKESILQCHHGRIYFRVKSANGMARAGRQLLAYAKVVSWIV